MSYSPSAITTYTPALTNVSNTTTETTFCSFVVPANTWLDGEVVTVRVGVLVKNNSGSRNSNSVKALVTGASSVTVGSGGWDNSATEFEKVGTLELMRVGTLVFANARSGGTASESGLYTTNYAAWNYPTGMVSDTGVIGANSMQMTPTSFASDITVSLRIAMGAAHATQYIKPQGAICYKAQARFL